MEVDFKQAIGKLQQAAAQFASGVLSPVAYKDVREAALADALRGMAARHQVTLEEPLQVDANGEYSIIAVHPDGPMLTHGCGKFHPEFAAALTRHRARTGMRPSVISPDNGWCRLNHMEAEKMVLAYAATVDAEAAR